MAFPSAGSPAGVDQEHAPELLRSTKRSSRSGNAFRLGRYGTSPQLLSPLFAFLPATLCFLLLSYATCASRAHVMMRSFTAENAAQAAESACKKGEQNTQRKGVGKTRDVGDARTLRASSITFFDPHSTESCTNRPEKNAARRHPGVCSSGAGAVRHRARRGR